MTQRSTKWAEKKNCKNLKKTRVFTRFLQHKTPKRGSTIPNAAQEWPKVCQNAMQKNDKKKSKKCLRGKKCLKPAISFWTLFGSHFWWLFLLIFKLIVYIMFFTTFLNMLILILKPILGSERPKRAKMSPKEPSGASKNQKPSFSKTLKNQWVF